MRFKLIRFSLFSIIFVLLLSFFSYVSSDKEMNTITLRQFYNEPKNSLDVLIFGPSITDHAIIPSVFWEEAGITSYNLSIPGTTAANQYYWLRESLRYQSPSVVVIYTEYMFMDDAALFHTNEPYFRFSLDPMRFSWNKILSIFDVVINDKDQTIVSYLFPIFRFHDKENISKEDFDFSVLFKRNGNMGYDDHNNLLKVFEIKIPNELEVIKFPFVVDDMYVTAGNGEYLIKFIDLCKANNICVVLVDVPYEKYSTWTIRKHIIMKDYADEHEIVLFDFHCYEHKIGVALDGSTDYWDYYHVNINGGTKISRYLAKYFSENYNLQDRRTTGYDPHWDVVVSRYHEKYKKYLANLEKANAEKAGDN